jgi:DNA repair protein RadC
MRLKDLSESERPRERLIKHGCEVLSSSELLAIILGVGSKKENVLVLSQKLISKFNVDNLSRLTVSDLEKVNGIGKAKACKIASAFELGRRVSDFKFEKKKQINSSDDIKKMFQLKLSHLKRERFIIVFLDARRRIIKDETIFVGSLDITVAEPREVFERAISLKASGIILIHNHPSGDPTPSKQDVELTVKMFDSGRILGVDVLDHVIFGNGEIYSFRDKDPDFFKIDEEQEKD